MIYLGSPGRMVGISCPAEQRLSTADRFSFQTTLEGRVKAQVRPEGRRVWDLRLPRTSTPSEVAELEAFVRGVWGPGPFWFISADAPHTNLLPPRVADMFVDAMQPANSSVLVSEGGPVQLGDQWVGQSVVKSNNSGMFFGYSGVPVFEGVRVTGSAWIGGAGGRVRLEFRDANGQRVGSANYPSDPVSDEFEFRSVSVWPPSGAASVRLSTNGAVSRAARPAVTWTHDAVPWASGQGCDKAVVHAASREVVSAIPGRHLVGASFVVTEVG